MKIGILTFHCAHNYGAILQCYALQEYLKVQGHNVEVIDYRPPYLLKPYSLFNINRIRSRNPIRIIKNFIRESILFYGRYKRYCGFESFIKNRLNLSAKVKGKNIPDNYDVYIIGSDQVWNPKITEEFDNIYFANFPFKKEQKKYISYAASMETQELNHEQKKYFTSALNSLDQISVRENVLCELLQPLTHKDIKQVLDPTLLIESSVWEKVVTPPNIKLKYVLVYQVRINERTMQIANEIAKQIGGIVIETVAWLDKQCLKNKYQYASPEMFLGLIKHASCIVTTSFHGTAFSVIFNKPFYTLVLNDGKDSRSLSLLSSVGLRDRAISLETVPTFTPIDYSKANQQLNIIRKESSQFLKLLYEKS